MAKVMKMGKRAKIGMRGAGDERQLSRSATTALRGKKPSLGRCGGFQMSHMRIDGMQSGIEGRVSKGYGKDRKRDIFTGVEMGFAFEGGEQRVEKILEHSRPCRQHRPFAGTVT